VVFLAAGATVLAKKAGMGASTEAFLGVAAFLVIIPLIGYATWMLLRISLAFPASVVEQTGAWAAARRSFALSQGTKGRIFLLFLLVAALGWLLSMGITIPLTILLALIPGISNPQNSRALGVAMLLIIYAASFAVQSLVKPVYGIALVLFYYDQRIRKEGFDIEWMMLQAGMVAEAKPVPEAAPWLPALSDKAHSGEPSSIQPEQQVRHEGYDIERMMDAAGLNAPQTTPSGEGSAPPAEAVEGQA
jgi:hypothetical protein